MSRNKLTQERLREVLHYSRALGMFTWRVAVGKKIRPGMIAGSPNGDGYVQIQIDGVNHHAHRLAYLYVRGRFPKGQVDHRNGERGQNWWKNLRVATQVGNSQNMRAASSRSRIGLLGVSRNGRRWKSNIRVDGKQLHLGTFDTPELAHAAYVEAKRKHHPFNTL